MNIKPPNHPEIPNLREFTALNNKMLRGKLEESQTIRWLRGAFYFESPRGQEWDQEQAYKAALHPGLANAKVKVELV